MGQNSTEVAYGFGQMGSAYTDLAQTIVPPQGMVIVAIQFLAANTPTVLTPEKLDKQGPGFPEITTGTNVTALASTTTRNTNGYFMGAVDDTSSSTTATLSSTDISNVKVGSYVLLVNNTYQEDGAPAMTIDSETPVPIYSGPNKQGVFVVSRQADGGDEMVLSSAISPSSQALIFLDAEHGAGGIISNGQEYPAGSTIYGRWTAFTPSAAGVICYFGV